MTGVAFQPPQFGRLRRRQPQTRHFGELGSDPSKQRFKFHIVLFSAMRLDVQRIDACSSARRAPVRAAAGHRRFSRQIRATGWTSGERSTDSSVSVLRRCWILCIIIRKRNHRGWRDLQGRCDFRYSGQPSTFCPSSLCGEERRERNRTGLAISKQRIDRPLRSRTRGRSFARGDRIRPARIPSRALTP